MNDCHNPYFNRLTFAIKEVNFKWNGWNRHNPYFNRLTFAICEVTVNPINNKKSQSLF